MEADEVMSAMEKERAELSSNLNKTTKNFF